MPNQIALRVGDVTTGCRKENLVEVGEPQRETTDRPLTTLAQRIEALEFELESSRRRADAAEDDLRGTESALRS